MNNCDLNLKLGPLTVKLKLKAEEDKIVQLQTHDLSYFLENNFFGDDFFQNMFIYQPTIDTLQLKNKSLLIIFLVGNQSGCILLSCIAQNFLDIGCTYSMIKMF